MDTGTLIARLKAAREVNRGVREALQHNLAITVGLSSKFRETLTEYVKLGARAPLSAGKVRRKKKKHQARLRRRTSDPTTALCSSSNSIAASPFGFLVRPCSISLTDDGERQTRAPMAANVIPFPRKSDIREAQVTGAEAASVVIGPSVRPPVDPRQRPPVTEFRDNMGMPKPADMPKDLLTIGARVRYWREKKKLTPKELANKSGYSYSGLLDLENERTQSSRKLHLIAAVLELNAFYLETGKGEPALGVAQEPPPVDDSPLPPAIRSRMKKLNKIERSYLDAKIHEALNEIESERRSKTG